MRKVRNYLGSSNFGVKLLIGSVVVQGFHSYWVFDLLSNFDGIARIISCIFYATILSSAILYFTMIGNKKVAYRFQIFETGINIYYFFKVIGDMLNSGDIDWGQLIVRAIIAIGISIMMPYVIREYAGSVTIDKKEEIPIKLSTYEKTKIRDEGKRDLLRQINSMEDLQKMNKKYFKNGK